MWRKTTVMPFRQMPWILSGGRYWEQGKPAPGQREVKASQVHPDDCLGTWRSRGMQSGPDTSTTERCAPGFDFGRWPSLDDRLCVANGVRGH
jgi:hypothetical protein